MAAEIINLSIKKTISYNKILKLALHVVFWLLLFSLPFLLRPHNGPHPHDKPPGGLDLLYVSRAVIWIVFFYLNTYVLIPVFFYKKKYLRFYLPHIGILLLLMFVEWLHFKVTPHPFEPRGFFFFNLFPYLFFLVCSITLRLFLDRIEIEKAAKEKETENLKTELSFLRSQISPHFMFNVLNNMVSLARKKSDLLEPSLIKLSSIMRYMIYENDEEKVPLEKEIEYLESYIDLQKQRFGKSVSVQTTLGPIDQPYFIEPMLLIPFVENSFKHGTGMVENGQIEIQLSAIRGLLNFTVRNRYNNSQTDVKDKTSGIGLENVKRRLSLLYKEKHNLQIDSDEQWFNISLSLNNH